MSASPRLIAVLAIALAVFACKRTRVPEAGAAPAMDSWHAWDDLGPLVTVASTHADAQTAAALERASALMRRGQFKAADDQLASSGGSHGRHWIAVARADLVALSFTVCIRGIAWRLENGRRGAATDREADFSQERRVEPGDVSVEATLTNLDAAIASDVPALVTQARIARARVAAFASRCPPNPEVAALAQQIMENDLATLAAEGNLTPDLAYLWAGVQMNRFSGAAARPFLEQAKEAGFDHPSLTMMLAMIALEARELPRADTLAQEAIAAYEAEADVEQQAQGQFVRGQIAEAGKDDAAARGHYERALALMPTHAPAMLAIADVRRRTGNERAAVAWLSDALSPLLLGGGAPLDPDTAREAAANVETLVIFAEDPFLAQACRDALLADIDDEPDAMRRGIRYFYAATLEVRLQQYEVAHGHGVLARDEIEESGVRSPIDVDAFLARLHEATGS